jgi:YidC/Oxa1 family membrane protein insertase
MDKNSTIGFILIGLVLIAWMWIQTPPAGKRPPAPAHDSTASVAAIPDTVPAPPRQVPGVQASAADSTGRFFAHLAHGQEKTLIIRTDLYTAEVTTRGGLLRKWELNSFLTWDKHPVHLLDYESGGDLSLLFTSSDGRLVNTRGLYFQADFPAGKTVELHGTDSLTVVLTLPVGEGKAIVKTYVFTNGRYSFDAEMLFRNCGDVLANYEYQVTWESGLRYAEANSVDESNFAKAFAFSGGELAEVDASSLTETPQQDFTGSTAWVAARTKYFAVALIPEANTSQGGFLQGRRTAQPNHGVHESYSLALKMPYRGRPVESTRITVFLGPLDFDVVKSYNRGLDRMMSLGAAWIIRPISEYVMLPLFSFLRWLIPNYGIVIILFSIIIKIALHPLTRTSMKSMKQMQALQPLMAEIREKHKDDSQKMNQQIMNLYKEYGVNPASGCLPLLLQMPILFALYAVFSSAIQLRQANFFGWIHDLSIPDVIVTLPFTIPLFGISQLSGLALAMGVTMFVQQKMTVTDPRQKAMVWMMPVMMTLLFNNFPSGLNLYYFVFNLLSIGQQMWMNKSHGNEPLRKVDPKKRGGGLMARISRDLPKLKQ